MSESEPGLLGEEGRVRGPAADAGYDYNNINNINTIQTEDIMNLFDDYQINPLDVLDVQVSTKEEEENGGQSSNVTLELEEKLSNIKDLCLRSDLSAVVKIDKILRIVDPSYQEVLPVPRSETKVLGSKRPADMREKPSASPSKVPKVDPQKNKADLSSHLNYNDGTSACVVCGLSLKVFRNDANKELIHYLR